MNRTAFFTQLLLLPFSLLAYSSQAISEELGLYIITGVFLFLFNLTVLIIYYKKSKKWLKYTLYGIGGFEVLIGSLFLTIWLDIVEALILGRLFITAGILSLVCTFFRKPL